MFATLFFDEAKANTSVLVRQRPSDGDEAADNEGGSLVPYQEGSVAHHESQLQASGGRPAVPYIPPPRAQSYVYPTFACHGSEPVPELRATLFWWLDDNRDRRGAPASHAQSWTSTTVPSPPAQAPLVVHLMLVDDGESAREAHHSQSRMLSVELPIVGGRQALLTCGISRLAVGGHCVAVAWMSRDFQAGYVRVTMQRNVNRASTLLLTSQGGVVEAAPLEQLQRTFRNEVLRVVQSQSASATRAVVTSNQAGAIGSANEFNAEHWMLVSGCVLSTVPVEERRAMAFFVLTSGMSVHRVQLYEDGSTILASFSDPKHRRETATLLGQQLTPDNGLELMDEYDESSPAATGEDAAEAGSPSARPRGSASNWLARWVRGDGRRGGTVVAPGESAAGEEGETEDALQSASHSSHHAKSLRRYLTVSAVAGAGYVTLVRASGHIEVLSADFELAERYAVCRLPAEQARSLHRAAHTTEVVQQWATLDRTGRCVHMLTCLGTQDNRRCIRSMVPAVEPTNENRLPVAVQCSYGLVPPTTMSSPISAAVDATGQRLLLLWDTGVEEDGHLESLHSVMSLAEASSSGRARCVAQVIETDLTPLGAVVFVRASSFLCHGAGAMQVALAQESSFVVINKFKAAHSAYVLQPAAHPLAHLVEGTLIGNDNESDPIAWPTPALLPTGHGHTTTTTTTGSHSTAAALTFVPTVEGRVPAEADTGAAAAVANAFDGFHEGMAVLNSSPQAANLLAALLADLFTKLTAQTQLATLPQIANEAYLNGYTPSGLLATPSIAAAVRLALSVRFDSSAAAAAAPLLENTPYSLFCRFGRLYLQQRVTHDLRQRVVFLAVTMLGAASARAAAPSADGTTALLAATLTQLLAAYHAAIVAGPELTNLLDAVHEDVVESLLSTLLFPCDDAALRTVSGAAHNEEEEEEREDATASTTLPPAAAQAGATSRRLSQTAPSCVAVRVAARLARCHTPRCTKACLAWCVLLKPLYPILFHFDATLDLAVGRTAKSTAILAAAMRVAEALAQLPVRDVLSVLIDDGLLLTDAQNATCFSGIPTSEVQQLLDAQPALAPKLYVAGLLRRATPNGSLQTALAEPVVRSFFLTELYQVWRVVRALNRAAAVTAATANDTDTHTQSSTSRHGNFAALTHAPFPILQLALEELRLDVLFCLALASLDRGAVGIAFHDLQAALDAALQLGVANAYTDVVHQVVHQAVDVACASQAGVHALTTVSIESPQLRDLVAHRWYNDIARLPTKSASAATESRRYRAIMGLHRFLMNQHAYAQCGRVMSDLATLLRCSPLRMATSAITHVSVSELANMALSAVELIDPIAPVTSAAAGVATLTNNSSSSINSNNGAPGNEEGEHANMGVSPTSRLFGSPVSLGHSWPAVNGAAGTGAQGALAGPAAPGLAVSQRRWLSRDDLPMLRRRVYQAHCERKLWARGSTLNCTDIWIEGVRPADFERGVARLIEALMQHRLWEEAFRFASLALCSDPCCVLTEWVKDLQEERRHVAAAYAGGYCAFADAEEEEEGLGEMQHQWGQLIRCCRETSTLQNQFRGFCMVVSAALTFDYDAALPALRLAHCETDVYTALVTLIEVIEHYRREDGALVNGPATAAAAATSSSHGDEESDAETRAAEARADASQRVRTIGWLVWQDAVRVASALLRGESQLPAATSGATVTLGRSPAAASGLAGFTAGVFDPLARYSTQLLSLSGSAASVLTDNASLKDARKLAESYLAALNAMK